MSLLRTTDNRPPSVKNGKRRVMRALQGMRIGQPLELLRSRFPPHGQTAVRVLGQPLCRLATLWPAARAELQHRAAGCMVGGHQRFDGIDLLAFRLMAVRDLGLRVQRRSGGGRPACLVRRCAPPSAYARCSAQPRSRGWWARTPCRWFQRPALSVLDERGTRASCASQSVVLDDAGVEMAVHDMSDQKVTVTCCCLGPSAQPLPQFGEPVADCTQQLEGAPHPMRIE